MDLGIFETEINPLAKLLLRWRGFQFPEGYDSKSFVEDFKEDPKNIVGTLAID